MDKKLPGLIKIYEDIRETIKTDYITKLAFTVGVVTILSTLAINLYFKIWVQAPDYAFWLCLVSIFILFVYSLVWQIRPIQKQYKKINNIINLLRFQNNKTGLNKTQEKVLDSMWNEVYRVANLDKGLNNKEKEEYLNRIFQFYYQLAGEKLTISKKEIWKKKIEKFINRRGVKTFILTIILFIIGLSSYLIEKSLEMGGLAIPIGILLVWGLLYITRIDEVMFR